MARTHDEQNAATMAVANNHILLLITPQELTAHASSLLDILDEGAIAPEHHLDKIFDRFYRVYAGKNKTFPGLGMGLYTSHEIVRRHRGDITVRSEEGQGSLFTVMLPVYHENHNGVYNTVS